MRDYAANIKEKADKEKKKTSLDISSGRCVKDQFVICETGPILHPKDNSWKNSSKLYHLLIKKVTLLIDVD